MRPRLRDPLRRGVARWPHPSLVAAGTLARATAPLRWGLEAEAVARVYPRLSAGEVERVRRAIWENQLRLRVADAAVQAPGARWPYPRLAPDTELPVVEPPVILVSFHIGALPAAGLLLQQLPGEVVYLAAFRTWRPGIEAVHLEAGSWKRAAAVHRVAAVLRGGGSAHLTIDTNRGRATVDAVLLGRRIGLARGAFALSRMTRAPVMALVPRWRGARVELVVSRPIQPDEETAMAAAVARWLERHLTRFPEDISPKFVAFLDRGEPVS